MRKNQPKWIREQQMSGVCVVYTATQTTIVQRAPKGTETPGIVVQPPRGPLDLAAFTGTARSRRRPRQDATATKPAPAGNPLGKEPTQKFERTELRPQDAVHPDAYGAAMRRRTPRPARDAANKR